MKMYFSTKLSIVIIQQLVKKYNLRFICNPIVGKISYISLEGDVLDFNKFDIEYESLMKQLNPKKEKKLLQKIWDYIFN